MEIVLFKIRTRPDVDQEEYQRTFEEMLGLVSRVPGFVGIEGYTGEDGSELAVARFESREAIDEWREDADHVRTRQRGREEFFDSYEITIGTIWRQYEWSREQGLVAPVAPAPPV